MITRILIWQHACVLFPLQTEVALVYLAVILFFKSLAQLTNSQNDVKTKSLNSKSVTTGRWEVVS
ncbi:hypothetical protein DPMN_013116 [Dreissena polymorpha]|uniref:Uncharacterized protein n=1 Tax=Dreissena polymorpha TaxID=45954 RepID=A0A9D4N3Q0_DREPO|nr:hypothetical protein DPMN_013116 [Dreissena polymorpha]